MIRTHLDRTRTTSTLLGLAVLLGLGLALSTSFVVPDVAGAQTEEELMMQKKMWQERYRRLLQNAAQLERNIATAEENYARAQRRNYPRGNARQRYLLEADDARKELVKVKQELEQIFVEARREAIPPGWLYAVEDEPITLPAPTPAASGNADDSEDDGRNPLYRQDDGS